MGAAMNSAAEMYPIPETTWTPNWPVVSPSPDQLAMIASIEREFCLDGKNRGMTWIQGEMLDNHEPDDVFQQGATIGRYERWQEIPDGLFATYPSAVHFIDELGLRFHLPAILRWVLRWGHHWPYGSFDDIGERAFASHGVAGSLNEPQRALLHEWMRIRFSHRLRSGQ
jgi:hypothetical protein